MTTHWEVLGLRLNKWGGTLLAVRGSEAEAITERERLRALSGGTDFTVLHIREEVCTGTEHHRKITRATALKRKEH